MKKITIDLTPRFPRLSWLNAKTHPQGNGGRKNQSGHAEEHARANIHKNAEYYRQAAEAVQGLINQ